MFVTSLSIIPYRTVFKKVISHHLTLNNFKLNYHIWHVLLLFLSCLMNKLSLDLNFRLERERTLSTSVGLDITLPTTPATTPQNTLMGKVSSITNQQQILQLQWHLSSYIQIPIFFFSIFFCFSNINQHILYWKPWNKCNYL